MAAHASTLGKSVVSSPSFSSSLAKESSLWPIVKEKFEFLNQEMVLNNRSYYLAVVRELPREEMDSLKVLQFLKIIQEAGILKGEAGHRLLIECLEKGNEKLAIFLIRNGMGNLYAIDHRKQSLLHIACENQQSDVALALIERHLEEGGDYEQLQAPGHWGYTPLHYACQYGLVEVGTELIRHYVDFDKQDEFGMTSLYWASTKGNKALANQLMDRGADPLIGNHDGVLPVFRAWQEGYKETAGFILLKTRPSSTSECGQTRVHHACLLGDYDSLLEMIMQGDDVAAKDFAGNTPLHYAAAAGHLELVSLLSMHPHYAGPAIDLTNSDGKTALHMAFEHEEYALGVELIQKGASVDVLDASRQTPLATLLKKADELPLEIVQIFKEKGIDFDEVAQREFLAHLWSIEGISHMGDFSFAYGGSFRHKMISPFVSSITDFYKASGSHVRTSFIDQALAHLEVDKREKPETIEKMLHAGIPLLFLPTWSNIGALGHGVALIALEHKGSYFLLKCNRGEGAEFPGIEVFEITQSDKFAAVVAELHQVDGKPACKSFFTKKINKKLGLNLIHRISEKSQTGENCGWVRLKLVFLGLNYLEGRMRGLEGDAASTYARVVYKDWMTFTMERAVTHYLQTSTHPDWQLIDQIVLKAQKPFFTSRKKRLQAAHSHRKGWSRRKPLMAL